MNTSPVSRVSLIRNLINCATFDQTVLSPVNAEISPASGTTLSLSASSIATSASSLSSSFLASAVRRRIRRSPTQAAPMKSRATSPQVSNLAILANNGQLTHSVSLRSFDPGHIGAQHAHWPTSACITGTDQYSHLLLLSPHSHFLHRHFGISHTSSLSL